MCPFTNALAKTNVATLYFTSGALVYLLNCQTTQVTHTLSSSFQKFRKIHSVFSGVKFAHYVATGSLTGAPNVNTTLMLTVDSSLKKSHMKLTRITFFHDVVGGA